MKAIDLMPLIDKIDTFKHYGRVKRVVGLMIESQGPKVLSVTSAISIPE